MLCKESPDEHSHEAPTRASQGFDAPSWVNLFSVNPKTERNNRTDTILDNQLDLRQCLRSQGKHDTSKAKDLGGVFASKIAGLPQSAWTVKASSRPGSKPALMENKKSGYIQTEHRSISVQILRHQDPKALRIFLDIQQSTCTGLTKQSQSYKIRLSKPNWLKVLVILEGFKNISFMDGAQTNMKDLEKLADLVFCHVHRKRHQASEKLNTWKTQIDNFISKFNESSPTQVKSEEVYFAKKSTHSVRASTNSQQKHLPSSVSLEFRGENDSNSYRTTSHKSSIMCFVDYCSKAKAVDNTEMLIRNALTKDLTPRELKHGWVYIYWAFRNVRNVSRVEIGLTTFDISGRLDRWIRKCKRKIEGFYPNPAAVKKILHVYRVEALVHAELASFCTQEVKCENCQRCNIEWFEVSSQSVIDVVNRWTSWMMNEPYAKVASSQ